MKFFIKHETPGRIRVEVAQTQMTFAQADTLEYYLMELEFVNKAKVHENTKSAIIEYSGTRDEMIRALKYFKYDEVILPERYLEESQREINAQYRDKIIMTVFNRAISLLYIPAPIRMVITFIRAAKYIYKGIRKLMQGKLEVEVLDATAIAVSIIRGDWKTAGSVMFMLSIGGLLEEWTHKRSVDDLAKSMSVNVGKVWLVTDGGEEVLVPTSDVKVGDKVVVRLGGVIPFDGVVSSGEAMVNQSSFTGEAQPVLKEKGNSVFAGTVLEDGEITIVVKKMIGSSRYDKIVQMIEDTEKLKSESSSRAEHLADKLVPITLGGTLLTYLITRNVTKALSVLMVDFSCALKLAMPIAVLSAMRESGRHNISVKGGKFLEAVSKADTIVFDKTGTLTKAKPRYAGAVLFSERDETEILRIAACIEEHFPHSMARAVMDAAADRNIDHDEMHTKVEYIVAHGIATTINGKQTHIGSYHYVFEDEKCVVPDDKKELFEGLDPAYSHLYLAIEGKLEAVLYIKDPLREEAAEAVKALREVGFEHIVMMTGDSERTAAVIAEEVGVDKYYSEVLPEDKARFVTEQKEQGHKVIMVGDGVNDSPALSAADAGIAISDGASIAREIADITIAADNLFELVYLKQLAVALDKRINHNYGFIVAFNTTLIVLGVFGIIPPTLSSVLHNASTLYIGLRSTQNLIESDN